MSDTPTQFGLNPEGNVMDADRVRSILAESFVDLRNATELFKTTATVPTAVPKNIYEQFVLYRSGTTKRFYWYNTTNNSWDVAPDPITDHGDLTGLADDDHTQYIKVDGTRAFTGDQSLGSHKLTSVTDPASAQDAATKNYHDTNIGKVADKEVSGVTVASTTTETTLSEMTIPALGTNKMAYALYRISQLRADTTGRTETLRMYLNTAADSIVGTNLDTTSMEGIIEVVVLENGSNVQTGWWRVDLSQAGNDVNGTFRQWRDTNAFAATQDSGGNITLKLTAQHDTASASFTITMSHAFLIIHPA